VIAVIACGNPNRCDDGAGLEVLRMLKSRGLDGHPSVGLFDAGTDGMGVMFAARGCRSLIVVDACRTGSPAGAVFEVPGEELEARHEPTLNLHDFRWDHALYAGRRIFRDEFPKDVVVLLIEAERLELGIGLSSAVLAAVATVAERVEALVRKRLQPALAD
jgi:hydrogenase maturation protease